MEFEEGTRQRREAVDLFEQYGQNVCISFIFLTRHNATHNNRLELKVNLRLVEHKVRLS